MKLRRPLLRPIPRLPQAPELLARFAHASTHSVHYYKLFYHAIRAHITLQFSTAVHRGPLELTSFGLSHSKAF